MPLSKEGKESANKIFKDFINGWKVIHSGADAFRGSINGSIDHIAHDHRGEEHEYGIADKGFKGLKEADDHFGWKTGVHGDASQVRLDNKKWGHTGLKFPDATPSESSSRSTTPPATGACANCAATCQHHDTPALPPRDAST